MPLSLYAYPFLFKTTDKLMTVLHEQVREQMKKSQTRISIELKERPESQSVALSLIL